MTTPVDQLISVIMIFRDAERFFDEAIESVLAQDHAPIELLLCDAGSTDASTARALRWVQRHPGRVTYLELEGHAHRGMRPLHRTGALVRVAEQVRVDRRDQVAHRRKWRDPGRDGAASGARPRGRHRWRVRPGR